MGQIANSVLFNMYFICSISVHPVHEIKPDLIALYSDGKILFKPDSDYSERL